MKHFVEHLAGTSLFFPKSNQNRDQFELSVHNRAREPHQHSALTRLSPRKHGGGPIWARLSLWCRGSKLPCCPWPCRHCGGDHATTCRRTLVSPVPLSPLCYLWTRPSRRRTPRSSPRARVLARTRVHPCAVAAHGRLRPIDHRCLPLPLSTVQPLAMITVAS